MYLNKEQFEQYISLKKFSDTIGVETEATSSHWRLYGKQTFMFNKGRKIEFNARAVEGDFVSNTFINKIKTIPSQIFIKKFIKSLPEEINRALFKVVKQQKRLITYNCVKNALSVKKLIKYEVNFENMVVAIIGDGNGFMGSLLKTLFPNIRIVQINLAKILLFDFIFTSTFKENFSLNLVLKRDEYLTNYDFNFIPAELVFEILPKDIDLFINIASMGEMNSPVIKKYFDLIRNQSTTDTFFYCCNRKEKILPDGTKSVFSEYGWKDTDEIIFDDVCEWLLQHPTNLPPFIKSYDGTFLDKFIKV